MTVTLPSSGTTSHRWRHVLTRAAATLAVLLATAAGGIALPAMPASAAGAAPLSVVDEAVPAVGVVLAPVGRGIVGPGEGLTVSVTVTNETSLALAPAAVTLAIGAEPLSGRAALLEWLDAGGAGTGVAMVDAAIGTVEQVAPSSPSVLGLTLTADDPALAGKGPGVYALEATYAGPNGPITSTSAMIVPDPAAPAAPVGVVVPITATPIATGVLTVEQLTALTAADGDLTAQLDAVEGTAAILAVDPAIAASIRVLGSSAPVEAAEWLQRLDALPNPRFALQFGDADVSAQLGAGLARPMTPTTLQPLLDPALFVPVPAVTPTPGPTPAESATTSPTEPVLPDLDTLLDIGGSRRDVFWPLPGSASAGIVDTLGGLGTEGFPSLTVIPSATTAEGATGATVPAYRTTATGAGVLVYDSEISAELAQAASIDDSVVRGAALTAATALLTFAGQDAGGAPVLVTPDRGQDRSRLALRSAISAVAETPGVQVVSFASLADGPGAPVEITDAAPDAGRVDAASALIAEEALLTSFSSILDQPSFITSPERTSILQLLGVSWAAQPAEWVAALGAHRQQTTATLGAVGIQPPSTIQLLSPEAPLPVWVRNDLPWPVNVVLFAEPDSAILVVESQTVVTAGADSNERVQVPVEARVGSGDVTIQLQLRSRTGVSIGETQFADVTVRADWEAIGLVILATLVAAFVTLGVVRTVLRRRSVRRADAAADADPAGLGVPPEASPAVAETVPDETPAKDAAIPKDADE